MRSWYYPLGKGFVIKLNDAIGYGDGYGKTNRMPFYRHFYAGGSDSVRGYEDRSLGPKDSRGKEFGGNLLVNGSANLIFPLPFLGEIESIRTALFLDAGQVYYTRRTAKKADGLRYSTGVSLAWNSPLGAPLLFSLSTPLNKRPGDNTQTFSFSFATSF